MTTFPVHWIRFVGKKAYTVKKSMRFIQKTQLDVVNNPVPLAFLEGNDVAQSVAHDQGDIADINNSVAINIGSCSLLTA